MSQERTIKYLIEILIENYNLNKNKAYEIVINSPAIKIILKENRDYFYHFNLEYWAEEIYKYYFNKNKF